MVTPHAVVPGGCAYVAEQEFSWLSFTATQAECREQPTTGRALLPALRWPTARKTGVSPPLYRLNANRQRQATTGNLRGMSKRVCGLRSQLQFFSQQHQCSLRQLFRVLAKLSIKGGIVVCVDAAFESHRVNRSIKE